MRHLPNSRNMLSTTRPERVWTQDGLPVDEDTPVQSILALASEEHPIALALSVEMDARLNPLDAMWSSRVIGCPPVLDMDIGAIALRQW